MEFKQRTAYRLFNPTTTPALQAIEIYTDGTYFQQQNLGGWGFVCFQAQRQIDHAHGQQLSRSSLEMEIYAVIKALEWQQHHYPDRPCQLYTDSKIVLEGLFYKYSCWQSHDWRQPNGKPVAFSKLWQSLYQHAIGLPVEFYWVKAHGDNFGNQFADQLARNATATNQL